MAPEATVTWLNGEVSRGHDEVRAYYQRMVKGEQRILDRYLTTAKLGASARFFGTARWRWPTGRWWTSSSRWPEDRSRSNSNWTSTSAKIGDQWQVVSLHLSANVFTNSLLAEAERGDLVCRGGRRLAGLLLGWLLGRRRRR
jgi:hypothetical protein